MSIAVQVKRGVLANRPVLSSGEFYYATDTSQLFVGPAPTLVGPSSGSSGAQGTTTINFGAFPGNFQASVVITGQVGILAGSVVDAWILPTATSDHSVDEHVVDPPEITAGNIVAGTGFTIYGRVSPRMLAIPNFSQNLKLPVDQASQIYGAWTIAWKWS